MMKNILTSKIITVATLITLAFGQLNISLATPTNEADKLINQLATIVGRAKTAKRAADAAKKDAETGAFFSGFLTGLTFGIYQPNFCTKYEKHFNNLKNQIRDLDNEEYNLNNDLNYSTNAVKTTKKEVTYYEQQLRDYSEQINAIKPKKLQYSDMALFFNNTASTFKYTDSGVKAVLNELSSVRRKYKELATFTQ